MASYRLRLDPWTAEFEGPVQLGDEEPAGRVDLSVETRTWGAVRPGPTPLPRRAAFVDGVRRVDLRLLIEDGARTIFGLLGSFGVGAVEVGERAAVAHENVGRAAIAGGGLAIEPVEVTVGGRLVRFAPETVPENTPVAPLDALQAAMRRSEAALAERLAPERDVVFLDGPLSYVTQANGPLVGFVKRLLQAYLEPEPASLLRRLEVGERTPALPHRRTAPALLVVPAPGPGPGGGHGARGRGAARDLRRRSTSRGSSPSPTSPRATARASPPTPRAIPAPPRTSTRSAGSRRGCGTCWATPCSCGAPSRSTSTTR